MAVTGLALVAALVVVWGLAEDQPPVVVAGVLLGLASVLAALLRLVAV